MKAYEALTARGQVRRLRALALNALERYGLTGQPMTAVRHGENTTFRLEADAGTFPATEAWRGGRLLVRIHRPGHQTLASIRSELMWLEALAADTDLGVPAPIRALDGALVVEADAPGLPEPRLVTVMRWVEGRRHTETPTPARVRQVGELMGALQHHGAVWSRPEDFERPVWDWRGLFDNPALLPGKPRLSRKARRWVRDTSARHKAAEASWGGALTLVHADLHPGNVVFSGGRALAIDFDDCGLAPPVYDLAVVLSELAHRPDYPRLRDALLGGFTQARPLPDAQLAALPLVIASRRATILQWVAARAADHPGFARILPEMEAWAMTKIQDHL